MDYKSLSKETNIFITLLLKFQNVRWRVRVSGLIMKGNNAEHILQNKIVGLVKTWLVCISIVCLVLLSEVQTGVTLRSAHR